MSTHEHNVGTFSEAEDRHTVRCSCGWSLKAVFPTWLEAIEVGEGHKAKAALDESKHLSRQVRELLADFHKDVTRALTDA